MRRLYWALLGATGLVLGCTAQNPIEAGQDEDAPNLPARSVHKLREPPHYTAIAGTEGALREATLFSFKPSSLATTLEVHSLVVNAKGSELSSDRETLYEVVSGTVEAGSGDQRRLHKTGDLWLAPPGKLTLRAKGELAALRAIAAK